MMLDKRRYPALWMDVGKNHRVCDFGGAPVHESVARHGQQRLGATGGWWLRHWLVSLARQMPEVASKGST